MQGENKKIEALSGIQAYNVGMKRDAVLIAVLILPLILCGCGDSGGSRPKGTVALSFTRLDETDYAPIAVTAEVKDRDGNPVSGETVEITSSLGTVSTVTDNSDGTYTSTLQGTISAEHEVTVSVPDLGISAAATVLVFRDIQDSWNVALAVPGDYVNTDGWEDGICVSPDGEWLFVHYSPMSISGLIVGDINHEWATRCSGPWRGPQRPEFFDSRISDTGEITHSFPLFGQFGENVIVPPTSFYGFRRQADGTFAEPFLIGIDDSGNGCLGPYGVSVLMTGSDTATMIFSFNDPATNDPGESQADVYTVDITLGSRLILGEYFNTGTYEAPIITQQNFLPVRIAGITDAEDDEIEGNPHIYADGGTVKSIWVDDEFSRKDIYVYELTAGSYPDGTWAGPTRVADRINTAGADENQPFFDGSDLYYRSDGTINTLMTSQYLGGAFDIDTSWTVPEYVFDFEGVLEIGRIIGTGEPTICQYEGKEYLYFVYVKIVDIDPVGPKYKLDLNAAFIEKK